MMVKLWGRLGLLVALVSMANLARVCAGEDGPEGPAEERFLVSHKSFFGLRKPYRGSRGGDGGREGGGVGGGVAAGVMRRAKRQATSSDLTAEEIEVYLNKHRELRSQTVPEAASMKYMTWNDTLATMAQQWSDMCIWDHGFPDDISPFDSVGQNLYLTTGGTSTKRVDGANVVQAWFNEDQYYDYETDSCQANKVCGHYTQVVWDTSFAVGCAQAYCPTAQETNNVNVIIVTCNYSPAGNSARQPFTAGPACSQCTSGVGLCQENQCSQCSLGVDDCVCELVCQNCGTLDETACSCSCPNGFHGPDCSQTCEDTNAYCGANPGWPAFWCDDDHSYVLNNCPALCNLCVEEQDSGYTCDDPSPTTPSNGAITTQTESPASTVTSNNGVTTTQNGGLTTVQPTTACQTLNCVNEGTFDSASCECTCTAEYQGNTCQHEREQARYGVEVRLIADIAYWELIKPHLLEFIARFLTIFCNERFESCCPESGTKTTSGQLDFVDASHTLVATGYPEADPVRTGVFAVLVLVIPPDTTELCQGGSLAPSSRRRRDTYEMTLRRHKRATGDGPYLDQAVLLEALQENMENLTTELQAATNVSVEVDSVEAGQEEEVVTQAPPTQAAPAGLSPGVIAAIVIVVVILVAVVIVASVLVYKMVIKKGKVDPGKNNNDNRNDVTGRTNHGMAEIKSGTHF